MATVRLQATMAYPYAGRSLSVGDQFDASEEDARLLKLVGQATDAPPQSTRRMKTRDLEPESTPPVVDETPAVRRRYRRRDLTAER